MELKVVNRDMYLVSLLVILINKVRKRVYQWNESWLSECPRVSENQLLQEGLEITDHLWGGGIS